MDKELRQAARANTMACFWPSKVTGLRAPVWISILGELGAQRDSAAFYGRVGDVQTYNAIIAGLNRAGVGV